MKLLAIDTSTEACSAAIAINGEIQELFEIAPRRHAELILPMVDKLLADAGVKITDLDALAFGRGPGAFTGLRIACGVTQGIAFGANLPVIPVSTLAALAQGAVQQANFIISAIDARISEIYWGLFKTTQGNFVSAVTDEYVSNPGNLSVPDGNNWFGVGTGWLTYHEILQHNLMQQLTGYEGERYPHAGDIASLAINDFTAGKLVSPEQAIPVYLRNKVTG